MSEFEDDPHEYDPNEFDLEAFRDVIRAHWTYHGQCNNTSWSEFERDDGIWQFEIAPPFQIVYGGAEDGKKVWTPFEFDVAGFLNDSNVDEYHACGVMSFSLQDETRPFVGITGSFRGKKFAMRIFLEPFPNAEPIEVIDRLRNEVRNIPGEQS